MILLKIMGTSSSYSWILQRGMGSEQRPRQARVGSYTWSHHCCDQKTLPSDSPAPNLSAKGQRPFLAGSIFSEQWGFKRWTEVLDLVGVNVKLLLHLHLLTSQLPEPGPVQQLAHSQDSW